MYQRRTLPLLFHVSLCLSDFPFCVFGQRRGSFREIPIQLWIFAAMIVAAAMISGILLRSSDTGFDFAIVPAPLLFALFADSFHSTASNRYHTPHSVSFTHTHFAHSLSFFTFLLLHTAFFYLWSLFNYIPSVAATCELICFGQRQMQSSDFIVIFSTTQPHTLNFRRHAKFLV